MSNPGFTLAEDAALKNRLKTLYVSDDRNQQRAVQVFFRYPEAETEKIYPFITIDLIGISHARQRQESQVIRHYTNDERARVPSSAERIDYIPSEYDQDGMDAIVGDSGSLKMYDYVPVDLTYQITTHCRSQRHDRQLTAALMRYIFPLRYSFIEIPEDGTIRRCDLLDWRTSDILDQESGYKKRIFRKIITVQINSEIPQNDPTTSPLVTTVSGTLQESTSGKQMVEEVVTSLNQFPEQEF